MALQRRGRLRYNPHRDPGLSREEIDHLLKKELGAVLIPKHDKRWHQTEEKEDEDMGLFSHLEGKVDVAAIPVNPFDYPDGYYTVAFKGATLRPITGDARCEVSLDFKYVIIDDDTENGSKYAGRPITEGKWIPSAWLGDSDPEEAEKMAGYAIQRIAQLGFGEDANTTEVEDINAACMDKLYKLRLKKSSKEDGGQFVNSVKLIQAEDEEDLSDL